ncbi:dihydroorotate dehydrogenase electron transfer subunit [Enterococcus sp. JM4C]|uniref:dihydroorotate dehydrogenase electron transfer subunit n=1 Tax=Candidatus Enterococcus huntleyi TaxID=1857217 RepID=UPI00137992A5|nr:dihydroorotate dehydrogenase electron transfer subunit [Enterococcus sp. JM4C]KAF1296065.1 dihydroorotate dehydrogenase electron transfer subunit [Enterococcus sp. JM4C]
MKQEMMKIVSQRALAPRIFELTLTGELVKEMGVPGQFIHIRVPRADLLLRRPISINQIDAENKTCTIIYRVEGEGTKEFSVLQAGDLLDVMGPLGNGFDLSQLKAGDTAFIVGGGIGIPPLYELSKQLIAKGVKPIHFLGYASKEVMYYTDEFEALAETRFATDDGSFAQKGHVGHLLTEAVKTITPDAVFACGANGLLKAVEAQFFGQQNVQLSLEARMACGMGACYACVCHVKNDSTGKKSLKVCDEGPIFKAGEVIL